MEDSPEYEWIMRNTYIDFVEDPMGKYTDDMDYFVYEFNYVYQKMLDYFVFTEDYEKCAKLVELKKLCDEFYIKNN